MSGFGVNRELFKDLGNAGADRGDLGILRNSNAAL